MIHTTKARIAWNAITQAEKVRAALMWQEQFIKLIYKIAKLAEQLSYILNLMALAR